MLEAVEEHLGIVCECSMPVPRGTEKRKKRLKALEPQAFFAIMVGVAGFEPAASWTRTKRDTKLRHTPIARVLYSIFSNVSSALMN